MRGAEFTQNLKDEARVNKLLSDYEAASYYELHKYIHKEQGNDGCEGCWGLPEPEHTAESMRVEVLRAAPGYVARANARIVKLRERERDARELLFKASKLLADHQGTDAVLLCQAISVHLDKPAVG